MWTYTIRYIIIIIKTKIILLTRYTFIISIILVTLLYIKCISNTFSTCCYRNDSININTKITCITTSTFIIYIICATMLNCNNICGVTLLTRWNSIYRIIVLTLKSICTTYTIKRTIILITICNIICILHTNINCWLRY